MSGLESLMTSVLVACAGAASPGSPGTPVDAKGCQCLQSRGHHHSCQHPSCRGGHTHLRKSCFKLLNQDVPTALPHFPRPEALRVHSYSRSCDCSRVCEQQAQASWPGQASPMRCGASEPQSLSFRDLFRLEALRW